MKKRKKSSPSSPYDEPAKLLTNIWKKHTSIQALAYNSEGNLCVSKQSYAVVSQVLKYASDITKALQQSLPDLDYNNKALLYILIYELLLSERRAIRGGGALQRLVKQHASVLGPALAHVDTKRSSSTTASSSSTEPRYVRINTCVMEPTACVTKLQTLCPGQNQLYVDPYVPHLLVVPRSITAMIQRELGHATVLQSQPSCCPAYCLSRYHHPTDSGAAVLDACAAPGNKTTQLAALLPSTPILAWDRDPERCTLLQRRCTVLAPTRVQVKETDYLTTPIPSNVVSILLDPSCSGNYDCDAGRIAALAAFQTKALQKALSCEHVTTVVYSTCSTQFEENEGVVASVLEQHSKAWTLVPAIPQWTTARGRPGNFLTKEQAGRLLRVDATSGEDGSKERGFFVACFVRSKGRPRNVTADWTVPDLASLPTYNGEKFCCDGAAPPVQSSTTTNTTATAPPVASKGPTSSKLTKKRAKKMEWKRRQRDSKKARIQAQKSSSEETEKR